jgi:hypothetical protein
VVKLGDERVRKEEGLSRRSEAETNEADESSKKDDNKAKPVSLRVRFMLI